MYVWVCLTFRLRFFKKIQGWIIKSANGFCISFLNRLIWDSSVPLTHHDPRDLRIDLFSKETQNPFSDSFGFKNPILDVLKETHPKVKVPASYTDTTFLTQYADTFLLVSTESAYGTSNCYWQKRFLIWNICDLFVVGGISLYYPAIEQCNIHAVVISDGESLCP